jgi:hypothetical protein
LTIAVDRMIQGYEPGHRALLRAEDAGLLLGLADEQHALVAR